MLGSAAPHPQTPRQLWGLTVRSERALRATAPLWPAQQAAWGGAADLLADIAEPASWLSQGIWQGGEFMPPSASVPLARMLLSSAATELKAARVAGFRPGLWIFNFMDSAIFRGDSTLSATAVSFLLPRLASTRTTGSTLFACNALMFAGKMCRAMGTLKGDAFTSSVLTSSVLTSCHMSALLSRSIAEVSVFSQAMRKQAHLAVVALADYADNTLQQIASLHIIQQGPGPLSQPEIRARLAHPIMVLLDSPLLDLLASLQHVAVGSSTSFNRCFPGGSDIPPVHLLPAWMAPDALDSIVAMQVRGPFPMFLP